MSELTLQKLPYNVDIHEPEESGGPLVFTFSPNGVRSPFRPRQFTACVHNEPSGLAFDWSGSPDDPGPARTEIEAEITARLKERETWIARATALVDQVEQWAKDLGWATRRIDKRLEDSRIGDHRVPALLMQQEIPRVLLEPIGASSLEAEGLVDLYLMPAYDDIARLYYSDDGWHILAPDGSGTPLSKQAFEDLLAEMKRNAA